MTSTEDRVSEPIKVIWWRPDLRGTRATVHHLSDEKSLAVDNNVVIEEMVKTFGVREEKIRVSFVDGYKLLSFQSTLEKKPYPGWRQVADWRKEPWAK